MKKEVLVLLLILGLVPLSFASIQADEDTYDFAPPFVGGHQLISLEHSQIDNSSFHVEATISLSKGVIYKHVYYFSKDGWQRLDLGAADWIKNEAEVSIEDQYDHFDLGDGDDLYVAAWACEPDSGSWDCGCKGSDDCGHWFLQGIDLDVEGGTPILCSDLDGDGFGSPASEECSYSLLDCDDGNASINPSAAEIVYNGVDDDCNASTPDDDLDLDGYLLINDCDDSNAGINPSAAEVCEDSIDQDCSGADMVCEQCGEGSIPATGCACAGSASYEGYCCDNLWQDTPCGTPETIFHDGFESGTANTWDYLNPYSKVNSDLPQSGQFSLDLIYTPGTGDVKTDQYAGTALSEHKHLYFKWYGFFEEDFIQSVDGVALNKVQDADKDWSVGLLAKLWQGDKTMGMLVVDIDGALGYTDSIVSNGRWYCFELEVLANDAGVDNGFVRLWLDDQEIFSRSGLAFGDGDRIGWYEQGGKYLGSFGNVPIHNYVDDVTISTEKVGC